MKLILKLIFTVLFFPALCISQPALVDGVVAVVGRNIVLKSDLDKQYEQRKQQAGGSLNLNKCAVFEDLLMEKLLLHQAALDSIEVSEDEVAMNIQRRIDYFVQQFGSQQRMEQYYGKTLLEIKEEMSPLVKDQMLAQRMMQEINSDISITPSEVRTFYNSIPEDSIPLINTEIEYAEIVRFPIVSKEAKQDAINRLKGIKERIEKGSSFSTMAVLYSEDPGSAKKGGLYEGIKRGQFVKEFEAVAFNLEIGEISEPFETEYGFHIVQLQMKRGQELDLRHVLIKPKISAEALQDAEQFLDSVKTLIKDGKYSFAEAAEKFSDEEASRLNGGKVVNPQSSDTHWELGQLDKSIFYTVESLEPGELSDPVFFRTPDEKEGYRLIKLLSRVEAHVANLSSDYQRVQNVALANKKQEALQDWVDEKLNETFVRVNNDYLKCEFRRNWIKQSQYAE